MNGLRYENFVRGAFGNDVERAGDPARLAEAGIFEIESELPKVKAATAYAMAIYKLEFSHEVEEQMDRIITEVIAADNSEQVATLINEFNLLRKRS
jgi:phage shock protein A